MENDFQEFLLNRERNSMQDLLDQYQRFRDKEDSRERYPIDEAMNQGEMIMASAPNPRAEKNSIAIELFGKPLFQLTPMEMEQLENFLQEKATKLAMGGIVSLAGGGSAGYPPIEVGIINTPDQNLNIGLSQNLNPFASYTRNFDMFGGQGGGGVYAERGLPPTVGAGFGMMDQGNQFSGNINYNQDRGPQLGLQYRREFEPGGGLNSLFRMK
jgi:hypothetical protein